MAKQSSSIHVSSVPFRFKFKSFDFITQWIMGTETHGMAELGECLYTTSRIKDADIASWRAEWTAQAQRVEKRALESMKNNHPISARQGFFRAYSYYRAPLVYLNPFTCAEYQAIYEKAKTCFQQAARLCHPALEEVAIPFEGQSLPGYFARAGGTTGPRPTLVMLGGGDTFVEDLYGYIVPAGNVRGYNVLIVDLPGQGILPDLGLPMRADVEVPMQAVVDFVLQRPEADPKKLAVYGISAGGYLAPRAAAHDDRIRAVVANSILLSFTDHWLVNAGIGRLIKMKKNPIFRLLCTLRFKPLLTVLEQIETYHWRWGVRSSEELVEVSHPFVLDPADVQCPMLVLIGENEYTNNPKSREWVDLTSYKAGGPVQIFIGPENEGTNSHATGTNLSLMSQIVFDWLDETLEVNI